MEAIFAPSESTTFAQEVYLLVSQDNDKQTIKIKEASDELVKLLGRMRHEMEGYDLQEFLGNKTAEAVNECMEYSDFSADLDEVLSKCLNFKLKHFNGEELPFAMRIYRDQSRDKNQWFRILLKDERRIIQDSSLMRLLAQNMDGIKRMDEQTGIPDRYSAIEYLKLLQRYVQSHELKVVFAVIRMDRYAKSIAKYGKGPCIELLKHMVNCCLSKFRDGDVVLRLNDYSIGVLLFDITPETARIVLTRLRWHIASHHINFGGKSDFSVTISLCFTPLIKDDTRDVLEVCEYKIHELPEDERNAMIELGA